MVRRHASIRRLSAVQLETLRILAEGRMPRAVSVATMRPLVRRELIAAVNGAPKVTELGLDVVRNLPGNR